MSRRSIIIAGSLFLLLAIPISAYLIHSNITLQTGAVADTTPKNLKLTALSDTSFTLEWETDDAFAGYIFYGKSPESMTLVGQDMKGNSKFKEHKILVKNLEGDTTYYYVVVSEEDTYQSEGRSFEVTTL